MRSRLSAPERRSQLLDVAGRLFAQHGYHALSMEQLAEAAGISKPVLYQHFPSKRDLYVGLITDAVAEMEAQVRKAIVGTVDNRARVEGAVAAYFDFVRDDRFQLLFATADVDDDEVRALIDAALRRVAEAVADLIHADAGLDAPSALLLATAVRGLATQAAQWWLEHPHLDHAEAVRLVARLAWGGLGSFDPVD